MDQATALEILKTGKSVFLTGEPGSGKTYAVNQYIYYLKTHGISPAVTASTGIAATHLEGVTIHSWSGLGIKKGLTPRDLFEIAERRNVVRRVQETSVLIIDEVSMLDANVLSSLNQVLKKIRESDLPFGGMQIILVGDFFQLPPVSKNGEVVDFAYNSNAWEELNPVICYLSEQHRQEDDQLLSLLTSVRSGRVTEDTHTVLTKQITTFKMEQVVTQLYSHNIDVDRINNQKLENLPGREYVYEMKSRGRAALVEQLRKGCLSPEILQLKKGSHVMFTKNSFERGFVNGTLG